jgi:starvation-inducible DNA-binding protein
MKNIKILSNNKTKLATPTDLGDKARQAISKVINPLIADAFALYVKTKNFHWHMSGTHYRDFHLLLDEQANQILPMIDILAERIRKLGGTTIRSLSHINELKHVADDNDEFVPPLEMIRRLMDDNKTFTTHLREAHEVCDRYHDIATASLLENFVDESEHRTWFLFETLAQ